MGKFKKGDRVRIITDHLEEFGVPRGTKGYHAGSGTLVEWDEGYKDRRWHASDHNLELINDHKFKVGDRVRIVKRKANNTTGFAGSDVVGETGIVEDEWNDGTFKVYDGDTYLGYFDDEELEPVKDEQVAYGDIADYPGAVLTYHSGYDLSGEWSRGFNTADIADGSITTSKVNNNLGERIMETLRTIPKRLKKVLDKDYKAMYQLNWLNGNLERTSKGTEELMDFLIDKYKDDLGALARERVAELEKEDE